MERAASIFFEAIDFFDWANGYEDSGRLPPREDVVEHLHLLFEIMREAERSAADARAYIAADEARMLTEDVLILTAEIGAELPEGLALAESLQDEMALGQDEMAAGVRIDLRTAVESMSEFALDIQQVITEATESTAETAASNGERKIAQCLRTRLYSYMDLDDITRMIEDDLVSMRLDALDAEARQDMRSLERQLEAARRLMSGCRQGPAASREGAQQTLQATDLGNEASDIEDLAQEILLSCS